MGSLLSQQEAVQLRVLNITAGHPDWPCRKGCDDCCRNLAAVPRVTREEWEAIDAAIAALPTETASAARERIRQSADAVRPVVCPLLDTASGACLIYTARPIPCRTYGFYAERQYVLGCFRIEQISRDVPDIVWGNHESVEERMRLLGPAAPLYDWCEFM